MRQLFVHEKGDYPRHLKMANGSYNTFYRNASWINTLWPTTVSVLHDQVGRNYSDSFFNVERMLAHLIVLHVKEAYEI